MRVALATLATVAGAALTLTSGCGEEGTTRRAVIQLERSGCKPSCAISSYTIWLHRDLGDKQRCTIEQRQSAGLAPEQLAALELPADSTLLAGAAAYCAATSTADPSGCCDLLEACLPVDKTKPECAKAAKLCPPDGDPFSSGATKYYTEQCKGSGGAGDCLVCFGEAALTLGGAGATVALTTVTGCSQAIPKAGACR